MITMFHDKGSAEDSSASLFHNGTVKLRENIFLLSTLIRYHLHFKDGCRVTKSSLDC